MYPSTVFTCGPPVWSSNNLTFEPHPTSGDIRLSGRSHDSYVELLVTGRTSRLGSWTSKDPHTHGYLSTVPLGLRVLYSPVSSQERVGERHRRDRGEVTTSHPKRHKRYGRGRGGSKDSSRPENDLMVRLQCTTVTQLESYDQNAHGVEVPPFHLSGRVASGSLRPQSLSSLPLTPSSSPDTRV